VKIGKLPDTIRKVYDWIETTTGKKFTFVKDLKLPGKMSCSLKNGPTIIYRDYSDGGAAEEILHLELEILGVAHLEWNEGNVQTGEAANMLGNLLHHKIIFPLLEKEAFQPKTDQNNGIGKQLEKIDSMVALNLDENKGLKASCAMVYARAFFESDSDEIRTRADKVFAKSFLNESKIMGKNVLKFVIEHSGSKDVVEANETLAKCISALDREYFILIK